MTALRLPALTKADAAAARRNCAPRAVLPLGGTMRLRWLDGGHKATDATQETDACVAFEVGPGLLQVAVPQTMIEACLCALDQAFASRTPPDDLTALLLETAFRDDLDRLEGLFGYPISVAALPHEAAANKGTYRLIAEKGEHCWTLHLDAVDCCPLETLMERWPVAPRPLARFPLPTVVRLGTTWLPVAALASLRSDDVVLVQFTDAAGARLVVAEYLLAAVTKGDGRWILTQTPRRARHCDRREWTMQHNSDGASAERPVGDVNDLPVQLTFDLGTATMELGELRTLGTGAVIELNRDLEELVRISAHGALIGQGELVEVDGHVGVRILRLFDHD